MEELIEMYHKSIQKNNFRIDKSLLKKYNFSETEWSGFLNLAEDLELNELGIRIILDEISSGRINLK